MKDPGLLVELERLVEREAISNGQLVEDSDLTQEAIFERLDNDIAFRAAATRLLQHYGYLLPTVNPNSEIGKEQDLVLKERARRLVQIEAQEDAESLKPPKTEDSSSVLAGDGNCDSGAIMQIASSLRNVVLEAILRILGNRHRELFQLRLPIPIPFLK